MSPITVTIKKNGNSLGASFEVDGGCITIKSIKKSGWFSGTKLKVGHEIISVNGSNCYGLSVSQVEKKFKNAGSTMSVIADNPMDTQRRSKIKL